LADGTPIGVAAARNLIRAVPHSVAVVRPGDRDLVTALSDVGLTIVENPLADQGLGTSLAAGVRATVNAGGWLVTLADMPWVDSSTIRRLADGLSDGAAIIAPVYRGRRGHPVGFAASWEERLQQMDGDEGARSLISANSQHLVIQTTDDAGVVTDIDYPHDLGQAGA
jgi:molybdenum cofactor cytidylyltransferase